MKKVDLVDLMLMGSKIRSVVECINIINSNSDDSDWSELAYYELDNSIYKKDIWSGYRLLKNGKWLTQEQILRWVVNYREQLIKD